MRWSGSGCDHRRCGNHQQWACQGHRWPAWLRSPSRELCTEAEHEPVDSLVHEILVANSAGAHCSFVTEGTGLGQGEKSAVFPKKNDHKSKWMNLFKCFSNSVDIIRGQARNCHANGSNGFDINPFSPISDSDRRLLDPSEASARDTFLVADPWRLDLSCAIAPRVESSLPIAIFPSSGIIDAIVFLNPPIGRNRTLAGFVRMREV